MKESFRLREDRFDSLVGYAMVADIEEAHTGGSIAYRLSHRHSTISVRVDHVADVDDRQGSSSFGTGWSEYLPPAQPRPHLVMPIRA